MVKAASNLPSRRGCAGRQDDAGNIASREDEPDRRCSCVAALEQIVGKRHVARQSAGEANLEMAKTTRMRISDDRSGTAMITDAINRLAAIMERR
jgi:hypothetical protein